MRNALALAAVLTVAVPAMAQDDAPPPSDLREGADMLSEGAKLILRGIIAELEPAAQESWAALIDLLDQIALYEPPEVLPNGDIIIRRKVPLEPEQGPTDL